MTGGPSRNFNPRAPCGARQGQPACGNCGAYFNPRAPCGARLRRSQGGRGIEQFQSTRPVRGATMTIEQRVAVLEISIHAPRAGRDGEGGASGGESEDFNPRAPCGARLLAIMTLLLLSIFQSTRPVRGATRSAPADVISALISIHAPRAGRDFLLCNSVLADFISIHAPRAGRDSRPSSIVLRNTYFNPRAPCGARRVSWPRWACKTLFQSTRPVRGATPAPPRCAAGP